MELYVTRHGESIYNTLKKVGGNSGLSIKGKIYAEKLGDYFNKYDELIIFTSELTRTIQTSEFLKFKKESLSCLNEIDAGICENLTYDDIKTLYPNIHKNRSLDKLNYKYPNGESYIDLINRINIFINNLKNFNNKKILIIAHQAILRVLIGILNKTDKKDIPYISIPLHRVIRIKLDDHFNIINTTNINF